jgi:hypothetical protein
MILLFYLIGMFVFYSVGYVVINTIDAENKGKRSHGFISFLVIIYPITILVLTGLIAVWFWNGVVLDRIVNLFSPTTKKEN